MQTTAFHHIQAFIPRFESTRFNPKNELPRAFFSPSFLRFSRYSFLATFDQKPRWERGQSWERSWTSLTATIDGYLRCKFSVTRWKINRLLRDKLSPDARTRLLTFLINIFPFFHPNPTPYANTIYTRESNIFEESILWKKEYKSWPGKILMEAFLLSYKQFKLDKTRQNDTKIKPFRSIFASLYCKLRLKCTWRYRKMKE